MSHTGSELAQFHWYVSSREKFTYRTCEIMGRCLLGRHLFYWTSTCCDYTNTDYGYIVTEPCFMSLFITQHLHYIAINAWQWLRVREPYV